MEAGFCHICVATYLELPDSIDVGLDVGAVVDDVDTVEAPSFLTSFPFSYMQFVQCASRKSPQYNNTSNFETKKKKRKKKEPHGDLLPFDEVISEMRVWDQLAHYYHSSGGTK